MKTRNSIRIWGSFVVVMLSLLHLTAISRAQEQKALASDALHPAPQTRPLTACSPDGEFYALATPDGRIRCGKTQEGAAICTRYLCHPRAMVFSPDSRLLAVAGGSDGSPARLKVWQVADGRLLCQVETGVGRDPVLGFSSDSILLASSGDGIHINFWQLPKGTLQGSLTTSGAPLTRLAFSKEGKALIALFGDGSVQRFPLP
ncbi:MAG: hypothetical protein V4675_04245 [Verrucomicrobiota bacterium]